jgi:hypothetical protein
MENNMDKSKRDDDGEVDWDKFRMLFEMEVSRRDAAKWLNISPSRISQLQKDGHLHTQPNGKLNLREAVIEYGDYVEHRSGGGRPLGT